MAPLVFLLAPDLGQGSSQLRYEEERVVAEAALTAWCVEDAAVYATGEDALGVGQGEGDGANEVRGTALGGDVAQPIEEVTMVGGVNAEFGLELGRCEALAADAGRALERVDAEARVVGEGGQARAIAEVPGLGERVGGEGIEALEVVLGGGALEAEVGETQEPDRAAIEKVRDLGELVGPAGGDEDPQGRRSGDGAVPFPSGCERIRSTSAEVERPGTGGKSATRPPRASTISRPTTSSRP
jgi:hypothetical protein